MEESNFKFNISLSVLNHLGRNLYRSFITVLGEAISNSWDAGAENVYVYIEKENGSFVIKDDGCGMDTIDFQEKFLKVGYSKRKEGGLISPEHRPYIGAKGIGKLALLSCAKRISIITKTENSNYIGGVIDNTGLDEAIKQDLTPDEYTLNNVDLQLFEKYCLGHKRGTIIYFEQSKEDIRNSLSYLKKLIALYFRFSLIDEKFNIYLNDELVTLDDIKELSDKTEFVWNINNFNDPFIGKLSSLKNPPIDISRQSTISGIIATVEKPGNLKIRETDEKVTIDLFVNGRLREKDILKHLPDYSTRWVASYLYGQIHFDELDQDGVERFTSSREGIISGDPKYKVMLDELKEVLIQISDKWDELRLDRGEEGDDENPRKTEKERRARSLYSLSSKEYSDTANKEIAKWIKELLPDAEFNVPAYVDCYLSENLIRKYIECNNIVLSPEAIISAGRWKKIETESKDKGNISIQVRQNGGDISYLSMDDLANLVDKKDPATEACLSRDAREYKPIRDAVAHTSIITDVAKLKLTLTFENIKGRIKTLLSTP